MFGSMENRQRGLVGVRDVVDEKSVIIALEIAILRRAWTYGLCVIKKKKGIVCVKYVL